MLQAGPEVHSNGVDLHLHQQHFLLVGEVYGDADDQTEAAAAIRSGLRVDWMAAVSEDTMAVFDLYCRFVSEM